MTSTISKPILFYILISVVMFVINFSLVSSIGGFYDDIPSHDVEGEYNRQIGVYGTFEDNQSLDEYGSISEVTSLGSKIFDMVTFSFGGGNLQPPKLIRLILVVLFEIIPLLLLIGAILDLIRGK